MTDVVLLSDGGSSDRSSDQESVVLFRLGTDPFVNAGAAALGAALPDRVSVTRTGLSCSPDDVEAILDDIAGLVTEATANTHRRTSIAHSINHALRQAGRDSGDARKVPPADEPFPDDLTVYEDDEIDPERLTAHDIPETESITEFDREQGLYVQSEEYIGNNSSAQFPKQLESATQYIDTFRAVLRGESSNEEFFTCQSCGRSNLPSYNDPETGGKVTYNQTFSPLTSTSATVTPLGSGGRTSSHKGRCVACLVTGFYFAVMPKPVRQTASDENDARVFTPVGDFEELVPAMADIRALRDVRGLDAPLGDENVQQRTIGALNTRALGMQALDIYEQFLRQVNTETVGEGLTAETIHRPTELRAFVSENDRTRSIDEFERIEPGDAIYHRVAQGSHELDNGSVRQYWPVSDILRWYAEYGDVDTHLTEKQCLAEGVIHADLQRLERGVFGFLRAQFRNDGAFPYDVQLHPADLTHYFTRIMNQATAVDDIDTEDIESIRRVASSIGTVFHAGDDISVLIGLQNANTQTEFLRAFEKASMQAQKTSVEEAPARYNAARDDDVEAVLELISDDDTFEPAKRMFVIHAALAAQYENATDTSSSSEEAA